ncbi:MAG: hypothetical protein ACHRHE_06645 [Tepidisphaerales bacterium]
MATGARVESIEALKNFKIYLIKFGEKISAALEDADSELGHVLNWLETEQPTYWASQIRKRHDALEKAKEALRMKKLFKDATGRTPSAVDEEKAVSVAKRRMDEAEQKAIATKKWAGRMQKEILLYKGQVMRLVTAASTDIPAACSQLNNYVLTLDQYMAVPIEAGSTAGAVPGEGQMTRAAEPGREEAKSAWAGLRRLTPAAMLRDAAALVALGDVQWPSGAIMAADREALVGLGVPEEPVSPGERIICAADAWKANAVYFERLGRLPDGASWYVGPADMAAGPVGTCVAVKAEELLRGRPDLREVLQFPEGFLVVISAGTGLGALVNPQDRDLLQKSEETAPSA